MVICFVHVRHTYVCVCVCLCACVRACAWINVLVHVCFSISGVDNYILVSSPRSHILQYVEMVGFDGGEIQSIPAKSRRRRNTNSTFPRFVFGPMTAPNRSFFLRFRGLIRTDCAREEGEKAFRRYSQTAVTPLISVPGTKRVETGFSVN